MARCSYCGTAILFGGVRDGELRFCNETCHQQGYLLAVADQVPEDMMAEHVRQVHQGECPKCGGPGPIDFHTSHTVWSALVVTTWRSNNAVCCRSCGMKSKVGAAVMSGIFGWWGFPWGFVMTPVQIVRNIGGLIKSPDPTRPSKELENVARIHLASQFLESQRHAEKLQSKTDQPQ
jgi:hypothetical protein